MIKANTLSNNQDKCREKIGKNKRIEKKTTEQSMFQNIIFLVFQGL